MAKFLAQTTPAMIVQGTPEMPFDVVIQNVSANDVYLGIEPNADGAGVKLIAGASYSNDYVTSPLYFYSAVADSEVRAIVQKTPRKGVWVNV